MMKHLRFWGIAALLVLACRMEAQVDTLAIPYSMSFEEADSVDMQKWVLNNGIMAASCNDQWMVGTDTKSDGKRSLYISDNGATAHFGMGPNIQFAYRDMILPQGRYIISFDWKCMGANNAMLYAGCGPASNLPCTAINNTSVLSNTYTTWCSPSTSQLKGQRYWQNARLLNINSTGNLVIRLFFAWCSNNTDTTIMNPLGACVDNIQICKSNCAPPTSLDVVASCDTTTVTWTGTSEFYQVGYRRVGDNNWRTHSGLTAPLGQGKLYLEGLVEGMYDFRVRSICATDTSVYTYKSSVVLFCPEAHCINYVNLHDTTGAVTCTYGTIGNRQSYGVIDYGSDDVASRHTVNWDIDAYDARTNNRLPLIPQGELASVRLGNWNTGAETESVIYRYQVDSTYAILLLKYAVVLEDPSHSRNEQPRFTLSIQDANGNEVDATCGSADFRAGRGSGNKGEWHYEQNLSWKEWTTYGVDLTPYIGQTLTIRVSTYDCTLHGHYGYGYFCLGCAAAKIEGVSCGDDAKMTAQAPDGFKYAWSPISNLDSIVSTTRLLEVDAADTSTYRCRLTYMEQQECHFDLYSSVFPRFPIAEFAYKYQPSNCENRVTFNNLSHIMVKYEGDTTGTHHYNEPCDDFEWVVNGERFSENNPVYIFPNEGGHFPVTLFSSIADGKCTDDTTIYVDIPAIGDVSLNVSDSICFGSTYTFGTQVIGASGTYTERFETRAGCDSICTLALTVLPQNTTTLPDTSICAETIYSIDGVAYPYTYSRQWIRRLQNVHGCDSTVVVNVTLLDSIKPEVDVKPIIEDTDLGGFYFGGSGYSYYTINGVRHTEDSVMDLTPDTYLIIFYNDEGCSKAETYNLMPGCIANIVYQRWNDVLSVKKPEYASGRSYVKYQWRKNGIDILGATKSYYYAGQFPDYEPTGHLDTDAFYEVAVTVDSLPTTEWQMTCPFRPIKLVDETAIEYTGEDVMLAPTYVHGGARMWLQTTDKARVVCHSPSGMLVFSTEVSAGRNSLEAPAAPGLYVVTVYSDRSKKSFKVCVTD